MKTTISFCMPFHDGGCKRRLDSYNLLREYYINTVIPAFEGSEFVTGDDDLKGEHLNRSRMRNNCAKQAKGDILFFIDADTWLSVDSIGVALSLLTEKVGMVQYQKLNWADDKTTAKIIKTKDFSLFVNNEVRDIKSGLVYVLRRDDLYKIGAWDERYLSWGYEDSAMQIAVRTLLGPIARVPSKYIAYHLFHPRPRTITQEMQTESCKANRELFKLYQSCEGNPVSLRLLIGLDRRPQIPRQPEPPIDAYASEEHYAEHIAPLFKEFYARGQAGRFYMHRDYMARLRPILEENGFPMQQIVQVISREDAAKRMIGGKGAIITSGIGDARVMKMTPRPVILIEHGAGQQYGNRAASFIGGIGREDLAMMVSPRDKTMQLSQRFYPNIPHSSGGCPKLDWYTSLTSGTAICISFHWHTTVCPESDWAYEEYKSSIAELKKFCDGRHIELIGHCHPRSREHIYPYYRQLGIRIVENFYDVCKQAQMYICDNSSTIFEFAALGRPVVLLNSKFYRRSVSFGLRFWTNTDVGVMVDTPETLVDKVASILDNEVEIDPEAIKCVYNNIGCASKVVADDIIEMLKNRNPMSKVEENKDMVEMVLQRELMLRGKTLAKGTVIYVDESEARRLEGYFQRGKAAAVRKAFIDIPYSEINPEFPFIKTLVAPTETQDSVYQGLQTLDTLNNDSITVIPADATAISNMSRDPIVPERLQGDPVPVRRGRGRK